MNNKGFTLIELLLAISLFSIVMIFSIVNITTSFSITNEESYEILKKSIVRQVENYIYECDNNLINCKNDYIWEKYDNGYKTTLNLVLLKKYAYLDESEFINPITSEDISNCMKVLVIKDEYSVIDVILEDNNCKKKK